MALAHGDLKIFTGSANPKLAESMVRHLGTRLGDCMVGRFTNGEVRVMLQENIRGADVFLVQPLSHPVNENLMELLIMLDACRRASARRLTAVVPFYAYGRQDRKARGREPISAKLVANLLVTAGADRVLTMDLHAPQIQGFFDIPLDHLKAAPILAAYLRQRDLKNAVVVAPDAGSGNRAREMAELLNVPIGFIDKRRTEPGKSEVMNIIGDVEGRTALMIEDMIDSGGTILESARALLERGVREVVVACTHPVLSGPGLQRILEGPFAEVIVTDSIPLAIDPPERIRVLSVAPLLDDALWRIHQDLSVSELF